MKKVDYEKQRKNLQDKFYSEKIDSLDLIDSLIEARISRDTYRFEKTQFKSRFLQLKTDVDKMKKKLRLIMKECDTKPCYPTKSKVKK